MIKLAVSGAQGRMGQSVARLALQNKDIFELDLKVLLENPRRADLAKEMSGIEVSTNLSSLKGCDVVIDFSTPNAIYDLVQACLKYKVAAVIGTTGLEPFHIRAINDASEKIPIIYSSNMSLGVNVLFSLIEQTSKTMKSFINEIIIDETHHIHKKDAPSGTAKTMRDYAEKNSDIRIADSDIRSHRRDEVVGDHVITFETIYDTITISHHAKGREMFAGGALIAAGWLVKNQKKNGLYNMKDVFGLK